MTASNLHDNNLTGHFIALKCVRCVRVEVVNSSFNALFCLLLGRFYSMVLCMFLYILHTFILERFSFYFLPTL